MLKNANKFFMLKDFLVNFLKPTCPFVHPQFATYELCRPCLDSKSESSEEEESDAETENPSKSTTLADNTTSQDTSDTNPANNDSEKSKTVEQETKTYEEKKGLTLVFYQ